MKQAAALTVPSAYTLVKVYADREDRLPGPAERVIKAVAAQRSRFPAFFGQLGRDGTVMVAPGAQIGLTVDVGQGLYLPVLHDAESLSLRDISAAMLRFGVKARRGRFTADDLTGANIAVTLHTESAVVLAQPIIFPGHVCALAVCGMLEELQAGSGGSVSQRSYFHLGLTYDHRVINGRDAVLFLHAVKDTVETLSPED